MLQRRLVHLLAISISMAGLESALAGQGDGNFTAFEIKKVSNVTFAEVDGIALEFDLYLPDGAINPPLLVWIHGGAWRSGTRDRIYHDDLVNSGYALASLDFRLSGQAKFPAQVHDIKAGIRFLRKISDEYGYDASRVAVIGASSGGHLAALVGVTNGHNELEGEVGVLDESSDVQAVISLFGASNLTTILKQSTPHGLRVRVPALDQFIGGQPDDVPDIAKLASPVFHVDPEDPPLLLIHGDQDPQMPINQSHELFGLYQELGLPAKFEVVYGAAHGGEQFGDSRRRKITKTFLDQHLR